MGSYHFLPKQDLTKQLVNNFVRSSECRYKCGDDGKNNVTLSTDELRPESLAPIEKNMIRHCGCHFIYTKKNRVHNVEPTCIVLEYYFEFTGRASSYPFSPEVRYYACALCKNCATDLEFPQNYHLTVEECSYGFPYDFSLRILFDKIFTVDEKEIINFQNRCDHFSCFKCTNSLLSYVYDCNCNDPIMEELNNAFIENGSDLDSPIDMEFVERQFVTPTPSFHVGVNPLTGEEYHIPKPPDSPDINHLVQLMFNEPFQLPGLLFQLIFIYGALM